MTKKENAVVLIWLKQFICKEHMENAMVYSKAYIVLFSIM